MESRAVLEVNLSAVKHNARLLKSLAGDAFFCPMIKADAYGHGSTAIAKTLTEEGFNQVGVINADEARPIRENNSEIDILIFEPLFNSSDLLWVSQENLVLVCSDWASLKKLALLKKNFRIHLKFDTGFSRLGFALQESPQLLAFLKDHPLLKLEGIASHLISGEELYDHKSLTYKQLQSFLKLKKPFPNTKHHLLNSSGLISQYANELNTKLGVRPGISLYGIKPKVLFKNSKAHAKWDALSFTLSSCLKSRIIALRNISKGDPVSYGACWKAKKNTKIATVSLGYADGFIRAFSKQRKVLFRGKKRPVTGTVCMDFFMMAVEEEKNVQLGEEVVIFDSQNLSPEEQAKDIDTIPYELFTSLGSRVKRIYKK